jgi:hypothetical protein
MQVEIDDFKTGWFGLKLGLTDADIAALISSLEALRMHRGHFHARSDFSGNGGVGDIEFYWVEPSSPNLLLIEQSG